MANIILIAGTYHGGWYWNDLVESLTANCHTVFAPTLIGLGEDSPSTQPIQLDDHVNQVVNLIESNDLNEVVLVGWSYGGMVITATAATTRPRVRRVIYLDAAVPLSGQCEFDLIPVALREKQISECLDGLNQYPSDDFLRYEPRMKPHPIGTKRQPTNYDESAFASLAKTYVIAGTGAENGPFVDVVRRIATEPNWDIVQIPFGHDLYRDAPVEIESIIREAIGDSVGDEPHLG